MAGKIIFVNSYKGGAGKTTLSMMHCIDDLFHEKRYKDVVYIDLDILGTGTRYLFEESKLPEEKCFDYTEQPVALELKNGDETGRLYVAYLSPSFKGHFSLGRIHALNHQDVLAEILKEKVIRFIDKCMKGQPETLIVLDCAPGFSRFEQEILRECYKIEIDGKAEVQEEYVTTLDASHVLKCIQCLNESQENFGFHKENRKIRLTMNDVQNFEATRRPKGVEIPEESAVARMWEEMAEDIKKQLHNDKIEIYRWRYSGKIAVRTTFRYGQKLENQVEDYIFTSDKYNRI